MQIRMQDFGEINPGGVPNWMRGAQHARQGVQDTFNLITQALEQQKMREELPYAGAAKKAQIASQNAYANLMGPQAIAKLMQNPQILPNVPDKQKFTILQNLFNSMMGNQEGINQLNQPQQANSPVANNIQNIMNQQSQQPQGMQGNPNLSPQDVQSIGNMQPGDAYQVQGMPQQQNPISEAMNNPTENWSQNVARARGLEEEGKQAGSIRAKQIGELDDVAEQASNTLKTADYIGEILKSPTFEKMRQNPVMGHYELSYYEKFGTPEQKQMVGGFKAATSKLIADASSVFKGAFRAGEQQLLEGGKPNDSDTVDAAKGKLEAISYLLKLTQERSQMTSDIMQAKHISKSQAFREADRLLTGNKIREEIKNKLYPKEASKESGFTRVFYQGKPHMIPRDKVGEALAAGGSLNG